MLISFCSFFFSFQSRTIAIVVPDPDVLQKYINENNLSIGLGELCRQDQLKNIILNDIKQLEVAHGLKGFEMVGHLVSTYFIYLIIHR